jgi:hypothetical protein
MNAQTAHNLKLKMSKESIMTTRHIESKGRTKQLRLKTTGQDRKNKNSLGHIINSQAAVIDSCLYHGNMSVKQIQAYAGSRTTARVRNHFKHLSDAHNLLVIIENDKCRFAV